MNKATEMVVGAFGGSLASEIMKLVIADAQKVLAFKYVSKDLASTMEDLRPIIEKIKSLQSVGELKTLMNTIARGRVLVQKCSGVQRWNLLKKSYYARKVVQIQKEMVNLCQVQLQLLQHKNQLESMEEIKKLDLLMKEINTNHQILMKEISTKHQILMKEINTNHQISIKKFDDFMKTVVGVRFDTKPGSLENTSSSRSMHKLNAISMTSS